MRTSIGAIPALLAALLAPLGGQEPKASVREFVTLAGTVERLDRATRTVKLRVDANQTQDVFVPPEIVLFDQLKTGDRVTARVRESVIISTRPGLKPQLPRETTADAAKARSAADPQVMQQLKAVVTIEAVDRSTRMVTYKTADNRRVVRGVMDPALLEGIRPGDVIEITFTRERVVELQRR